MQTDSEIFASSSKEICEFIPAFAEIHATNIQRSELHRVVQTIGNFL